MPDRPLRDPRVSTLLAALVAFDLILVIWAFALPHLWLLAFHVDPPEPVPELARLFLARCGANWAAFLLFQAIALVRWRHDPRWLLVVAGVRLSDIFTDPVYALMSDAPTWFSWVALPPMGAINLAMGVYLFRAYGRLTRPDDRRPPSARRSSAPS